MKKGIIFDMDGTLWDTSESVAASWNEALKAQGYCRTDFTAADIQGIMGLTMDAVADRLFGDLGREERMTVLEKCCILENDYLRKNGGVLYPDLEDTLVRLKEKYPLYIVSNCQKGYIEAFLAHYGFEKYFDDIECFGNNLKSKGENIAAIAERNGLDHSWYVGDIQGDCDAAESAGSDFIHASYGFGTIDHTVPVIREFRELPELILSLDTK